MHIPHRTRGIVAGLGFLVVSPIVLTALTQPLVVSAHNAPHASATTYVEVSYGPTPFVVVTTPTAVPTPTMAAAIIVMRTPIPTPKANVSAFVNAPDGPAPSAGTVEADIYAAATKYGVSYPWMVSIAKCESGMNPHDSPNGPYYGLFQFLPSTFRAHGGTDIFSAVQQSDITANMLAHGGSHSWPVCSLKS